MNLAFHFMGCVRDTGGHLATNGSVGPMIDQLARHVDSVTLVAWEPPPREREEADRTDYRLEPCGNIELCSLGPKGSWRDYIDRRRRVSQLIDSESRSWDVLVFWLVNRRAELVFRANRCPRIVSWIGGHTPSVVRATAMSPWRRIAAEAAAWRAERVTQQIFASSELAFVVAETLLDRYRPAAPYVEVLRDSSRSSSFAFAASDRLISNEPVFIVVGRLTTAKGVHEALEAFAGVRVHLFPHARLEFVGAGPERGPLEQECARLGLGASVGFRGHVPLGPALYDLFRSADVLLFLSHAEGFPRVVPEALAHSVLVVTTRAGALESVFSHRREVMFVDSNRPAAVVATVRELKEDADLRQMLIRRGFEVAQGFTTEAAASDLIGRVRQRWPEIASSV